MGDNTDDATQRLRATIRQAIEALNKQLAPYLAPLDEEQLTNLRSVAALGAPRALSPPLPDSDLGRLQKQLTQMCEQLYPLQGMDDLRAELEELRVRLEGTLLMADEHSSAVHWSVRLTLSGLLAN